LRTPQIDAVLEASLSKDRLAKYLTASDGDIHAALGLYEKNMRLSESFYSPLQCMEICLRNKLNDRLESAYGPYWFCPGKAPFQSDAVQAIADSIRGLDQARKPIVAGAIVAELSFGFWVALLGPRYDSTIWRKALFLAFLEGGKRMRRDRVHGRFNALRRFRNRIAHHEPVFHDDLTSIHAETIEAMAWMCPQSAAWAAFHSRFAAVAARP
jgi:hypothetical protein